MVATRGPGSVLSELGRSRAEVSRRFGVERTGIFGSFIRDEARPDSDIDILVTFKEGEKTFDNYMDLKFFLEDLFGRSVDLVTTEAIKPRLRDRILGEVVYA
jgi:predicted nucleotidyltransferase